MIHFQDQDEEDAERIAYRVVLGREVLGRSRLGCSISSCAGRLSTAILFPVTCLAIAISRKSGTPLQTPIRSFMETRFSYNFSRVRIHTSWYAPLLARLLYARAFTFGNQIFFVFCTFVF